MSRWEPDARGRLEQAALTLYRERGFDRVTVAEIAEQAGLTERTFFRHYADKREVLFAGSQILQRRLTDAVAQAPTTTAPMDVVINAVAATGPVFDDRRDLARQRQAIIAANPELQERELIKLAALTAALTAALHERGVGEQQASLAAHTGMAVFHVAFGRWVTDPGDGGLADHVRAAYAELRELVAPAL
jgi:AcrR family transcriptional regulator